MKRGYLTWCSGLVLALILPACGGGGSSAPTPVPTPTPIPCTQTRVLEDSGGLPASTVVGLAFSTSTTGRLDVTVDWTFPASPIAVFIVQGACTLEQFNARTCNFLLRSESGPKPRKVSASNVNAGSYTLLVANYASQQESVALQVVLSSSSCPPLAAAVAASGGDAGDSGANGQVTSMLRRR